MSTGEVVDLLAALQRSVDAAKKDRGDETAPKETAKKTATKQAAPTKAAARKSAPQKAASRESIGANPARRYGSGSGLPLRTSLIVTLTSRGCSRPIARMLASTTIRSEFDTSACGTCAT